MGRPVELVLAVQWSHLLTTPVLLFDDTGALVFFNEAAALILGRTYGESGPLAREEWAACFLMEDPGGGPLTADLSPICQARELRTPSMARVLLRGMDGIRRMVDISAAPLGGLSQPDLGVIAFLHRAEG